MKKILFFESLFALVFLINSCDSCKKNETALCDGKTISQKVKELLPKDELAKIELDSAGFPYVKNQFVLTFTKKFEAEIDSARKSNEKQFARKAEVVTVEWMKTKLKDDIQKHFSLKEEEVENIKYDFCECDKYVLITLPVEAQPHGTVVVNGQSIEGVNRNFIAIKDDKTGEEAKLPTNPTESVDVLSKKLSENSEKDIIVGIEDTGYDYELMTEYNQYLYNSLIQSETCTPNDIHGWNLVEKNGLNDSDQDNVIWDNDPSRHGTIIAENIIRMNNTLKNKNSFKILPVKSHDEHKVSYLFHIMCGIRYAANKGARILNASYRFYHTDPSQLHDLKNAIAYAKTKNMLIITSAGNDGCTMNDKVKVLPAQFYDTKYLDNIVVVTSIDKDYTTIPSYANKNSNFVHIAAQGTTVSKLQTYLFTSEGTSFATGIVSGYATYLLSSQPSSNLTYQALRNNLLNGSHITNVSALFPDVEKGRVLHYWLPDAR